MKFRESLRGSLRGDNVHLGHRRRLLDEALREFLVWDIEINITGKGSESGSDGLRRGEIDIFPEIEVSLAVLQISVMGQLAPKTPIVGPVR